MPIARISERISASTVADAIAIREITRIVDPAVRESYELCQREFDEDQLVGPRDWAASLASPREPTAGDGAWHLIVGERDSQVVGVATGTYLPNVNVGAIGYLAVDAPARGLGLGPRLRDSLKGAFVRDAGEQLAGVVGEVRRDNPWLAHLIRSKHVLALDFPYVQPGLRRGEPPIPMVFYYEGVSEPRREIEATELAELLHSMWLRVYHVARPMASAAFRRMIDFIIGRRVVGPLSRA